MRFAVCDPPYIGYARYYPENTEVDHAALIAQLERETPEGWALCLHAPSLRQILALLPDGARVGAWVKPWCSFKPGINPAYAWEPVVFRGGRPRGRDRPTVRDWVAVSATTRRGLVGAKPLALCYWIFEMLGAEAGDEMIDMFPGTGAVTRAWDQWQRARAIGFGSLSSPSSAATTLGLMLDGWPECDDGAAAR